MSQPLGEFLRTLRRQRGLSQVQLADRAQIAERTLRYWESGKGSPRNWELESVLKALEVTPLEHHQALALLTTPRGVQLARQETSKEWLGPLPGLGELLQAMRRRRRWTQEQLASAMGEAWLDRYYRVTKARTLVSAGKAGEALNWIPPLGDSSQGAFDRVRDHLNWMETLLEAGEKSAAHHHASQLRLILAEHPYERSLIRLNALATRL